MLISNIKITNFRSVKAADFSPAPFNVFVGQNNHGKTNVFEAIAWFYDGGGSVGELSHGQKGLEFSVEVEFSGVRAGIELMKNEGNKKTLKKQLGEVDTMRVLRKSSDLKKRFLWVNNEWAVPGTGFDKALDDALPRMEYVRTTTNLAEISAYKKTTPIGAMLSGVLTTILEKSKPYQDFRDQFDKLFADEASDVKVTLDQLSGKVKVHLQQQFPDCTKVSFEISEPAFDDLLKGFDTTVNDGIETPADQKGDGMQRALMLAIIKTYAEHRKSADDQGKNFLFLLDEAEVHLHPSAQRQLKEVLMSIAMAGDQVFINTHSSVLIAEDHAKQSIYLVVKMRGEAEGECGHTCVSAVTEVDKPGVVYELLGGSPSDLLLPRNFLIVEGHSDSMFLQALIKRHYADQHRVLIIAAGGDIVKQAKSMEAINNALLPLHLSPMYKERLVILCDKPNADQEEDHAKFLATFPYLTANKQIHVLHVGSIEECYPGEWKRTSEQVKAMDHHAKKKLAALAGSGITKEAFEAEMAVVKAALDTVWKNCHV
jgi:putative ATP-dependent endonuclease of OLD family